MRRRTPGVKTLEELLAERRARCETYDPARLVRVLEPLVFERRRERIQTVLAARLASVTVVFDSPYDPHNGAAVLRTCEAFGVQRLHILERKKTPFLAAASVARGAGKWVDVVTHDTCASVVATAAEQGLELVLAHPEGELVPADLAAVPRLAIVIGNERDGVQPELSLACRRRVRVPMRGFVESLNVSVTTAILLHEATKGRAGDLPESERMRLYARALYFSVPKADTILAWQPDP